jgi:hypothetical protein
MKVRVEGTYKGAEAFLEWEDGQVIAWSDPDALARLGRVAIIFRETEPFPSPEDLVRLEDWMSHPRGFVMCASRVLQDAKSDWVDEEMEGLVWMR